MEIHQYWTFPRHRGRPIHHWQRSWACSTIIEEREVSWSWQHPSRTGLSRWRRRNHRSYNTLQQDLADRRLTNPVDPVLSHHTSKERQPAAVAELPNDQPHLPSKQSHAEDYTEQMEAASEEDHCWRSGRLESRKEHHRADFPPKNFMWKISPAPARPLPRLHRRQGGLRQGLVCSFVCNHEEVHQRQPYPRYQTPLW